MKIWWGYRFAMEGFIFFGIMFYFTTTSGYLMNYRRRFVWHKQKRERSKLTINIIGFFKNPYFVSSGNRQLSYDKSFNVITPKEKPLISALL